MNICFRCVSFTSSCDKNALECLIEVFIFLTLASIILCFLKYPIFLCVCSMQNVEFNIKQRICFLHQSLSNDMVPFASIRVNYDERFQYVKSILISKTYRVRLKKMTSLQMNASYLMVHVNHRFLNAIYFNILTRR